MVHSLLTLLPEPISISGLAWGSVVLGDLMTCFSFNLLLPVVLMQDMLLCLFCSFQEPFFNRVDSLKVQAKSIHVSKITIHTA